MKITVTSPPTKSKENLKQLYECCNKLFKDDNCFYTSKEVQELKKDKTNIFLN